MYGPYTVTSATEYIPVRFRGRLMAVKALSTDLGSFWRLQNPERNNARMYYDASGKAWIHRPGTRAEGGVANRADGGGFSMAKMLYGGPLPITIALCLAWGTLFAYGLHVLIRTFDPGIIAMVFAYGAGAYVSVPNFGLFAKIPSVMEGRHFLIEVVPFLAFVAVSVVLYFI